jgi:APA family basic amino acid/polyamine antiporter
MVKALAFAAFIVACFALVRPDATSAPAAPAVPAGGALLVAFILAMQSVIFTYDGYAGVSYFAGEIRDPGRDIPRSMFGGTVASIVIYLLVNIALLHVLSIDRLAGEAFPAGAAATVLFGPRGDTVLRTLVVVSLFSSASAMLLIASRIFYGTSAGGLFPKGARVSENGTPSLALPVSALVAIGFILRGTFEEVLAVTAFFFVANYLLAFLSVFVLRRREPNAPRPFRAVAHPWTTGFVLAGSTAFLAGSLFADTRNSLWSLGLLVVSWPVYRGLTPRAGSAASPD